MKQGKTEISLQLVTSVVSFIKIGAIFSLSGKRLPLLE